MPTRQESESKLTMADMGTVHDLIEAKGKAGTLAYDFDRAVVEAASTYMADEDAGIGFLYSGWCQAALPHRKLANDKGWQIEGERVTLIVEPGMRKGMQGEPESVGVPYGSRARLILLRLQSEALRTQSREVELGRNLNDWLMKMGIPVGGRSFKEVKDQTERISRCRLTFEIRHGNRVGMTNQNIMESAIFFESPDPAQGTLFAQHARLSEAFFTSLQKHPVPIEEAAIRAIANNSMAIDIYAWLAYRLHALPKATPVSWRALKQQFGISFSRLDNFKATFCSNLKLAMAVYREAKIEDGTQGLILYPSKPPVAPRQIARSL
jgi:Plasmid encoded RepA protein